MAGSTNGTRVSLSAPSGGKTTDSGRATTDPAPSARASATAAHSPSSHSHSVLHAEREWYTGANTFSDPHTASGLGPKVAPGEYVLVSCKLHDPSIASANPGGYWYRIASLPWNNQYYAVANTFLNGDPWGGPYTHATDLKVPDC